VNTEIELHDSTAARLVVREGTVMLDLLPAYLHKSTGRPGIDSGTGWVQDVRLKLENAVVKGKLPDLPCDILDGELLVGTERHDNAIPVPLAVTTPVELRMVFDSIHSVTITAGSIRVELLDAPEYVEDFKARTPRP
jgi:hypothetical protein